MTVEPDQLDFFSDATLLEDPYSYFEQLRSRCPVTPIAQHGVIAVTGYDEYEPTWVLRGLTALHIEFEPAG